jgi:2-(1,2-epoxy-1,2-dihydrophenyl)acetyl-CoA isomerase
VDDLLCTVDADVATLTLNRPDRLNALSDPMIFGLIDHLIDLGERADIGAIVLTGAGRGFCAGGDVKTMAAAGEVDFDARVAALKRKHAVITILRSIPKIVVAMINGPAVGAGLALALACDFRIASTTARLGATYASVGLSGDYGISFSLAQLVGLARAQDLLFTGRVMDAGEALQLGLVNQVVPLEDLASTTETFVRGFVEGPRLAYGRMKQAFAASDADQLQQALDIEAENLIRSILTSDHREAAEAFTQKRKPVFQGR